MEDNSRDHSHAAALLGRLYFRLDRTGTTWPNCYRDCSKQGRIKAETLRSSGRIRAFTAKSWQRASGRNRHLWPNHGKPYPKKLKGEDMRLLEDWYNGLMRVGLHAESRERDC